MAESMRAQIYREIYLPSPAGVRWKEITFNTGASASTLQDIKVPESCGGYSYQDSGLEQSPVRNRFIYWKASSDVLEVAEQSFDVELFGCRVKFRFQDTPILDGVSIHESQGNVVILVATVASVHRLVFPHPRKLQRGDFGYVSADHPVPSVFFDASIADTIEQRNTNTHMLNPGGSITSHFHSAATYLNPDGEALFALASNVGSILLVKMPPFGIQGIVQQIELSQSSVMQKLWTGLVPSVIRGGQESTDATTSLLIHTFRGEEFIFCVCRDHRLRVWSTKNKDCRLICNLLDFSPDGTQIQGSTGTGTGHMIRKVSSSNIADLRLGVYLSFPDRNQFCLLQPVLSSGRMQISHVASKFGPQEDLIDFCVTPSHLISLWTSSTGNTVVRMLSIGDQTGPNEWRDVILQPPEIADLNVPPHKDPREVYLERIFEPGRFSMNDIRRALSLQVYSEALDLTLPGDAALTISNLKNDVTKAVENEIRNAVADFEIQEDEYYQLQLDQWTKFYSCCIQYHEVGAKLKGVFADSVTGCIGLIRKGCLTYVRPCDQIEELYYGMAEVDPLSPLGQQIPQDDLYMKRDLEVLWETLQMLSMEITDNLAQQFEHEVSMNQGGHAEISQQLITGILNSSEFEEGETRADLLSRNLQSIHNLPATIEMVLRALDLSPATEDDQAMDDSDLNASRHMSCSRLFTSLCGTDILAGTVAQFVQTRFSALRDLLLLQMAALRLGDKVGVSPGVIRALEHHSIHYTNNLLKGYLVVKWTTQVMGVSTQTNTLDFNMRQLSSLDISEPASVGLQKMGTTLQQSIDHHGASLLELFVRGVGGEQARMLLTTSNFMEEESSATWSAGLLALAKGVTKLVWPLTENFLFPEFLIGCCQYLPLQEYVRLLRPWCEWNAASRHFVLGLSYLHFGETLKAAHCFNQAREGVANESFLHQKLLQTEETQVRKLEVLYYLKVIRQFEDYGAPDIVISLAKTAIGVAEEDDPNLPTLWSKLFKFELELGHNTEAYNAMIANPEPSRRKDCLRQLLVMLCDRGDLQALVDFPYTDLEEEVEQILETRARSVDLTTHNYYDLLYAFHIFRNNYRKAASVMYEHGWRLGREVPGKRGLQRQAQCYLAALNALRLGRPEYAWIVKPVPSTKLMESEESGSSPKHRLDGEEVDFVKRKMDIIEMTDMEKEFMLVDARLRLINRDPDPALAAGPTPGPDEMAGLLVNAGLFDRAVIVCRAFNLSLQTVFESLALRCVNLAKNSFYHMRGDNDYTAQAWDWLKLNQLSLINISRENSSADQAWQLLQQYLDRYEIKAYSTDTASCKSPTQYHRCVARKLLSHGFSLPSWFVGSYKRINCAELLRLYIDFDMLEEAVHLAVEYVDAVTNTFMGQDSQVFDLKGCLRQGPQTVWLPYTCIDQLLHALKDRQDPHFGGLFQSLQNIVTVYNGRVRQLTGQLVQT